MDVPEPGVMIDEGPHGPLRNDLRASFRRLCKKGLGESHFFHQIHAFARVNQQDTDGFVLLHVRDSLPSSGVFEDVAAIGRRYVEPVPDGKPGTLQILKNPCANEPDQGVRTVKTIYQFYVPYAVCKQELAKAQANVEAA